FLYRCVAQHVSPKPERFIQADLMTEDTRKEIVESLDEFFGEYVGEVREKKVARWRRDLGKRLDVQVMPTED
ncbi:MAG: hypothetical protein VYC95_08420, partial [Verrucomicrobiota bacterium]|nr:hypothetical protein [Verrucomicrobiota bacterium]